MTTKHGNRSPKSFDVTSEVRIGHATKSEVTSWHAGTSPAPHEVTSGLPGELPSIADVAREGSGASVSSSNVAREEAGA